MDSPSATATTGAPFGERLAALRAELARHDLTGFLVPRADEHQGEYVPPHAERLVWLTGFDGSAGLAVVLADKAAIFVDGRYTLQVREQVDTDAFAALHVTDNPPHEWIAANLPKGARLGYDPWLHTQTGVRRLSAACVRAGAELVACSANPLDRIWADQPAPPTAPLTPHQARYAGQDSSEKRRQVAATLKDEGVAAAVLTQPDSIAWLLNVRGADVPRAPLPLAFAVLHDDARVELFLDPRKVTPGLGDHLGDEVRVAAAHEFGPALDGLGADGARVRIDPASAASWVYQRLKSGGATIDRGSDPCALPKACKNEIELEGARAAHRRDGAALSAFLAWLAREAPAGKLDELAAAGKLLSLRRLSEEFRDSSFDTISGAGANGAIVHYRVNEASNLRLEPGTLYLVDSGAQYPDGTTDVTRTVAIGTPSAEMRDRFTRVLKGHIALATACFPEGTTGTQLDILARQPLWAAGLDYDHGTGHGVGSYLSVHEGPQRISKLANRWALRPGMIVSNEPGYYKSGAYGIRIENLLAVRHAAEVEAGECKMLEFETLTLAPIDLALVEPKLLTAAEVAWLDAYHAHVREVLTKLMDDEDATWLAEATRRLARSG